MSEKLLAIGKGKSLESLKLLGFEIIECENFKDLKEILENQDFSSYTLLIIAEDVLNTSPKEISSLYTSSLPPVLILPTPTSMEGIGRKLISQLAKETLGIELWKES